MATTTNKNPRKKRTSPPKSDTVAEALVKALGAPPLDLVKAETLDKLLAPTKRLSDTECEVLKELRDAKDKPPKEPFDALDTILEQGTLSKRERRALYKILEQGTLSEQERKALYKILDPAFLTSPTLLVAQHLDLDPDVLIYDDRLGNLGLVKVLHNPEQIKAQVREQLNRATYLRHLLLTDHQRERDNSFPLTVELVLVTVRDEDTEEIGTALRWVARETSFLQAIGVNLLPYQAKPFAEKDLRRAFSWLLRSTQRWYANLQTRATSGSSGKSNAARPLGRLELTNYRLPGKRILNLSETHRLHLIHGHNGSGKSSLAEALELAVTGQIERIRQEEKRRGNEKIDYDKIIRNRSAAEPASIKLYARKSEKARKSKKEEPFLHTHVTAAGIPKALASSLDATAFRLDQVVMERLARSGAETRAAIYLTFFSDEKATRETFKKTKDEANHLFDQLPEAIRKEIELSGQKREDAVHDRFTWTHRLTDDPQAPLERKEAEDCLSLPQSTLKTLLILAPDMEQVVTDWEKAPPRAEDLEKHLSTIDTALRRLHADLRKTLNVLALAKAALNKLLPWHITESSDTESSDEGRDKFGGALLNDWLESKTLAELAAVLHRAARAYAEANAHGWTPKQEQTRQLLTPLSSPIYLDALVKQRNAWTAEHRTLYDQLMKAASQQPKWGEDAGPEVPPPILINAQIDALDEVGPWLFPDTTSLQSDGLGQLIRRALNKNDHEIIDDVSIGQPGWAQKLLDRLETLEQACKDLASHPPLEDTGTERLKLFTNLYQKYDEFRLISKQTEQALLEQIRALINALNELMALFTPARWAYENISLELDEDRDYLVMKTSGDGADADLRFNTAELNLFTLALFLLCAPRLEDNPLRLLILDDPVQNMDELTVTTVARGLARWMRLLPEKWQVMMLLHDEEDMDRFIHEAPAAVYQLPWLSPVSPDKDNRKQTSLPPIQHNPDQNRLSERNQDISKLIVEHVIS